VIVRSPVIVRNFVPAGTPVVAAFGKAGAGAADVLVVGALVGGFDAELLGGVDVV
jgi:hypothetical protein